MLSRFIHETLRIPYRLHVSILSTPIRDSTTVVFLHGIGNSLAAWQPVIDQLDGTHRLVAVDLLGFGTSPAPADSSYDTETHVRAIRYSLRRSGIYGPCIFVGHSLGSLLSIEVATYYPELVSQLILCSLPLYRFDTPKSFVPTPDDMYKLLYDYIIANQDSKLVKDGARFNKDIINQYFNPDKVQTPAFTRSLANTIMNQNAYQHLVSLTIPIHLIFGVFDPVVIRKHLVDAKRENSHITLQTVLSSHDVVGPMATAAATAINNAT